LLPARRVGLEHLAEGFEHVPALGGEVADLVDDVAAAVGEAVVLKSSESTCGSGDWIMSRRWSTIRSP
jgi:hypothetical protein